MLYYKCSHQTDISNQFVSRYYKTDSFSHYFAEYYASNNKTINLILLLLLTHCYAIQKHTSHSQISWPRLICSDEKCCTKDVETLKLHLNKYEHSTKITKWIEKKNTPEKQ